MLFIVDGERGKGHGAALCGFRLIWTTRCTAEVQNGKREPMPSKYPSKYKIDLHIDDDISVKQNGDTYGFRVMIIGGDDPDWAQKIVERVEHIRRSGS